MSIVCGAVRSQHLPLARFSGVWSVLRSGGDLCCFDALLLTFVPSTHPEMHRIHRVHRACAVQAGETWDPVKKRMGPWMNMKTLKKAYGKGGGCAVQ